MKKKTALFLCVALLGFAADQVTKYLAVAHLTTALDGSRGAQRLHDFVRVQNLDNRPAVTPPRPELKLREVHVLEGYWNFRYVENPGAAWGLFSGLPEGVRTPFFLVVTLAAMAFVLEMFRRAPTQNRWMQISLGLVFGGAVGNLADRLMRSYVIDFIDWHWRNVPGMHWPTFNVADSVISVGVAMLVVDAVRSAWRTRQERQSFATASAAGPAAAPVQGEGTQL